MATVNNLHEEGAVLVELSDDRLAEVEKAKRTGNALVSVGQRGTEIVDRAGLRQDVAEVSNEGSTNPNVAPPDYLVALREGVDDEIALNQQKAKEHSEVSAQVASIQMEEEVRAKENLRLDPDYYANLIAKNQARLAVEYAEATAEVAREQQAAEQQFAIDAYKVRIEDVNNPNPVTAAGLAAKAHATDISERQASDSLVAKDRIIFGEDSFAAAARTTTEDQPQTAEDDAEAPAKKTRRKSNEGDSKE